jgi:hypothetical protein
VKGIALASIGVLCLATAGAVAAVLPPIGYIGIFADTSRAANSVCTAQYESFEAWIWCLPSENGMQGAEFAVRFPADILTLNIVTNPVVNPVIGALASGIAFNLNYCQTDWVWTHCITLLPLAVLPSTIDIIPNPWAYPAPAHKFTTCEEAGSGSNYYMVEPCINLTPLYFCWAPDPGPIGVEETSWGAIKALYR